MLTPCLRLSGQQHPPVLLLLLLLLAVCLSQRQRCVAVLRGVEIACLGPRRGERRQLQPRSPPRRQRSQHPASTRHCTIALLPPLFPAAAQPPVPSCQCLWNEHFLLRLLQPCALAGLWALWAMFGLLVQAPGLLRAQRRGAPAREHAAVGCDRALLDAPGLGRVGGHGLARGGHGRVGGPGRGRAVGRGAGAREGRRLLVLGLHVRRAAVRRAPGPDRLLPDGGARAREALGIVGAGLAEDARAVRGPVPCRLLPQRRALAPHGCVLLPRRPPLHRHLRPSVHCLEHLFQRPGSVTLQENTCRTPHTRSPRRAGLARESRAGPGRTSRPGR
eukprot:732886-Rhodomonas_salina.1